MTSEKQFNLNSEFVFVFFFYIDKYIVVVDKERLVLWTSLFFLYRSMHWIILKHVYQPACVLSSKYEQLLQIKTSVDNLPVIPKLSTSLFIDKEIKKALKKPNQITI